MSNDKIPEWVESNGYFLLDFRGLPSVVTVVAMFATLATILLNNSLARFFFEVEPRTPNSALATMLNCVVVAITSLVAGLIAGGVTCTLRKIAAHVWMYRHGVKREDLHPDLSDMMY